MSNKFLGVLLLSLGLFSTEGFTQTTTVPATEKSTTDRILDEAFDNINKYENRTGDKRFFFHDKQELRKLFLDRARNGNMTHKKVRETNERLRRVNNGELSALPPCPGDVPQTTSSYPARPTAQAGANSTSVLALTGPSSDQGTFTPTTSYVSSASNINSDEKCGFLSRSYSTLEGWIHFGCKDELNGKDYLEPNTDPERNLVFDKCGAEVDFDPDPRNKWARGYCATELLTVLRGGKSRMNHTLDNFPRLEDMLKQAASSIGRIEDPSKRPIPQEPQIIPFGGRPQVTSRGPQTTPYGGRPRIEEID